eukprot:g11745.t1
MPQRKALLELARDRLLNFYAQKSNLEDPKETDGIVFRLSKDDKSCAGDMVPLTFLEFDIPNARPVDVFNVLMAAENETQWDSAPSEMRVLGEWKKYQARGVVGFFDAKPLSTREVYEWQVASANFTSQDGTVLEEFWVVYSTLQNDELRSKEPVRAGAMEMQNCLCAYRITLKAGGGVHVVNTQQVNEHPFPLSARTVANLGWQTSAAFGSHLRTQSQKQDTIAKDSAERVDVETLDVAFALLLLSWAIQEQKGWAANKTEVPAWMLKDKDCVLEKPDEKKGPSHEEMKVWQQAATCGGSQAPLFHAEFVVFNAVAAKSREAKWNSRLKQVNMTGFTNPGVRGVHEEFATPSVLGWKLAPREAFEWQAAQHNSSRYDTTIPSFNDGAVRATQCVAAYEVVPDGKGSRIRLVQHLNANVGVAEHIQFLWEKTVISMLGTWASELTEEARNILLAYDAELLELLSPSPLHRNSSLTIASVLSLAPKQAAFRRLAADVPQWQRAFGKLPLTKALNVTEWENFESQADEVMSLFRLVEHNATDEEKEPFASRAHDALDVQRQGEALASLQWRYLEVVNLHDCNSNLPDINGDRHSFATLFPPAAFAPKSTQDHGHRALPFAVLIGIAVAFVALLLACLGCCGVKLYRMRRNRQARQAASLLLSAASSCAASDRPS